MAVCDSKTFIFMNTAAPPVCVSHMDSINLCLTNKAFVGKLVATDWVCVAD